VWKYSASFSTRSIPPKPRSSRSSSSSGQEILKKNGSIDGATVGLPPRSNSCFVSEIDWLQRQYDKSIADGERALAINPNYAVGYMALSDALVNDLKPEEALRAAEKATRLDPSREDSYLYAVGNAYNAMGRYAEAIPLLELNLAAYPNSVVAHLAIIVAYAEVGRDADAQSAAADLMRISPSFALAPIFAFKNPAAHKNWETDSRKAGLK